MEEKCAEKQATLSTTREILLSCFDKVVFDLYHFLKPQLSIHQKVTFISERQIFATDHNAYSGVKAFGDIVSKEGDANVWTLSCYPLD